MKDSSEISKFNSFSNETNSLVESMIIDESEETRAKEESHLDNNPFNIFSTN